MFLKTWIKKAFSDIHAAIISIIVLSVLGLGGTSLLSEKIWLLVKNTMISPTPLWVAIVLAVAIYIYSNLRIKLIHTKENPPINKINIDDYDQPKDLFGVSKCKKTGKLYCTSCLIKNIKSPVITEEYRWRCSQKECNYCYYNQKYRDLDKKKSRVINPGITIDDI